ncbi:MAG: phosphoglycerate dehydrogenase [Acidimicrobiia bacterium]|nr:phosphoglycerate dehydrogenase [Acidimicrobiia bacterium]
MARILVTEEIADSGLDKLRAAGHDVDVRLGLSAEELLAAVPEAHALIVRSATKVTPEVLAAGTDLVVVGRAGIGLDNVDVETATQRGVMVVNAPESNILSAAEHTVAMLLAQARNIPQAHAALVEGRWERSQWEGVELADKTLGIIGLGKIGRLVAQRAAALGMHLVAYDPYVGSAAARQLGLDLVELDELLGRADFITIHVARTKETVGLLDADRLARAKDGVRVVNVARGGIVDEAALADAIRSGRVAGAALDVFAEEPTTASPLFGLPGVIVTPHLGASTREAQDKAGETIAEQVALALGNEFVPFAVNIAAGAVPEAARPFLGVAERLGNVFLALNEGVPDTLEVVYQGQLAEADTRILTLSVLKGVFSRVKDVPVSYVNAPLLAAERGVEVKEVTSTTSEHYVNLITVRGGDHAVAATLVGVRGEARLVMVDDNTVDLPPAPNMLYVRNEDRPGMIGRVGTILGEAGVNIDDMDVGRDPSGEPSTMVLATKEPVDDKVLARLRAEPGIVSAQALLG